MFGPSGLNLYGIELARARHMAKATQLKFELEQEEDGRWIYEVPSLPGMMTYRQTKAAR